MKPNFILTAGEYSIIKFPAGELNVTLSENTRHNINDFKHKKLSVQIQGSILSSDALIELLLLVDAITREGFSSSSIYLFMPYCAYSRQDRVCNDGEAFSLKVFANIINSLNLKEVQTVDNHSDVSTALLNNCKNYDALDMLKISNEIKVTNYNYLVSPDAGANKKVFKIAQYYNIPMIRADKTRDVKTGKIIDTQVFIETIEPEIKLLIVDDICEGGKTFIELAKAIKKIQPNCTIDLYVSHGFFSKGLQDLFDYGINTIYTTNSVVKIENKKLIII